MRRGWLVENKCGLLDAPRTSGSVQKMDAKPHSPREALFVWELVCGLFGCPKIALMEIHTLQLF